MQSASPIAGNPASHAVSRSADPSPSNASRRDRLRDFFRYHGIWAPGVRLFRRIGFQSKASILTAVFLVPIGLLSWQYFQDKAATIGFTQAERQGVQAMQHIVPVMKGVIDTRNATRALLGGYPAQADYQSARQATDQALASLAAHVHDSGDPLQIAEPVRRLQSAWQATANSRQGVNEQGRTVFGPVSEAAIALLYAVGDRKSVV